MKNMKLNKKGFTLIELLAVIVILAILVTVSIPAVTKYLNTARKGTYTSNAQNAIGAVRNDVISNGASNAVTYYLNKGNCTGDDTILTKANCESANKVWVESINSLLEKQLKKSPYSKIYDASSYIMVTFDTVGTATYSVCLVDVAGNGIAIENTGSPKTYTSLNEEDITDNSVFTAKGNIKCTK